MKNFSAIYILKLYIELIFSFFWKPTLCLYHSCTTTANWRMHLKFKLSRDREIMENEVWKTWIVKKVHESRITLKLRGCAHDCTAESAITLDSLHTHDKSRRARTKQLEVQSERFSSTRTKYYSYTGRILQHKNRDRILSPKREDDISTFHLNELLLLL